MKFLQKTWVAWLLTAVMIAAAVGIGQSKGGRREPEPLPSGSAALDESLSTEDYADYVLDEAGVSVYSESDDTVVQRDRFHGADTGDREYIFEREVNDGIITLI